MIFHTKQKNVHNLSLKIDDIIIERVAEFIFLGLTSEFIFLGLTSDLEMPFK